VTARETAAARRPRELASPRGIAGLRREIAALGGFGRRSGALVARGSAGAAPRGTITRSEPRA